MKRREFIALLGGAAAMPLARPLPTRAQQAGRIRRIGVLMNLPTDDPQSQLYMAAFHQGLQEAGWSVGRNVLIDHRSSSVERDQFRKNAAELVALGPDVILGAGGATAEAVHRANRSIPVVLAQSIDPVGAGVVSSLARPGGNVTGFTQFEYSLSGKWLELLREIAPGTTRVGIIRDPISPAAIGQWAVIQAVGEPIGVEPYPLAVREAKDVERVMAAFQRGGTGGLIVPMSAATTIHRSAIIAAAVRHRLPAVYPFRYFAAEGGLVSYGADLASQYRRAAGYVDRILKGEKPADLPVQRPTKYELVINLKTAKAIGLTVPPTLLTRADEVIE